jgi:cation diffusion facilitator family transporter
VGAFIITTGIAIFWEAINAVFDLYMGTTVGKSASVFALIAAIFTVILKIYLYIITKRNVKLTGNPTLRALANDHLNDIMASISVVIGVIFGRLGFTWMDPLAGAVVAIFILRTGISIVMESSAELMDSFPDDTFMNDVKKIANDVPGVMHVDDLGVHRFGPYFVVNLTIGVDGDQSIHTGHDIADQVEHKLIEHFSGSLRKVNVHYHPGELCKGKGL